VIAPVPPADGLTRHTPRTLTASHSNRRGLSVPTPVAPYVPVHEYVRMTILLTVRRSSPSLFTFRLSSDKIHPRREQTR